MTAFPLVGLAHGSRDPAAGPAIVALMAEVARRRPGLDTAAAFLDLAEPDLTEAVRGVDGDLVVVLPLLFTNAFHTKVDVPQSISAAAEETGRVLVQAEILGMGEAVVSGLTQRAEEAGVADTAGIVLAAVGSSDEPANDAVRDLAARWSSQRSGPVVAAFATAGEPKVLPSLAELAADGAVAVAPLFLAPGLLLRTITKHASTHSAAVAAPLGLTLTDLVLQRYDEAVATHLAG